MHWYELTWNGANAFFDFNTCYTCVMYIYTFEILFVEQFYFYSIIGIDTFVNDAVLESVNILGTQAVFTNVNKY